MLKVYLSKQTQKWLDKQKELSVSDMVLAAKEVVSGLNDGVLGSGVFKKRISNRKGRGRRGASRLLIAYKKGNNIFFLFAYNKNEIENVTPKEKKVLQARSKIYFNLSVEELKKAVEAKLLFEIGESHV